MQRFVDNLLHRLVAIADLVRLQRVREVEDLKLRGVEAARQVAAQFMAVADRFGMPLLFKQRADMSHPVRPGHDRSRRAGRESEALQLRLQRQELEGAGVFAFRQIPLRGVEIRRLPEAGDRRHKAAAHQEHVPGSPAARLPAGAVGQFVDRVGIASEPVAVTETGSAAAAEFALHRLQFQNQARIRRRREAGAVRIQVAAGTHRVGHPLHQVGFAPLHSEPQPEAAVLRPYFLQSEVGEFHAGGSADHEIHRFIRVPQFDAAAAHPSDSGENAAGFAQFERDAVGKGQHPALFQYCFVHSVQPLISGSPWSHSRNRA